MPKWTMAVIASLLFSFPLYARELVRHELNIVLQPKQSQLEIEDHVFLDEKLTEAISITFVLHGALVIVSPGVKTIAQSESTKDDPDVGVPWKRYELVKKAGQDRIVLQYKGAIGHDIVKKNETPGLITDEGVFLASSTLWYPRFNDDLITFALTANLPGEWDAVSQGVRRKHELKDQRRIVRWEEENPQDDIYLVAARYTEYTQAAGAVEAMAFLREPDQALAQKYLDVTAQYLAMYSKLLGPYPYAKFALVENFWDTGYGMPSFTLLGSRIIRFPFILHGSYPHEILHNWWGNGVYVDYSSGNWAEGLTAYLADHLINEQRGAGVNTRRSILQKYTDYVSEARDFPLVQFQSRHSSASEAVGYGKTLMMFHMLRQQLGDNAFVQGLRRLYRKHKFQRTSFTDVQIIYTEVAGKELTPFFTQWTTRTGSPQLKLKEATAKKIGKGYRLSAIIQQTQAEKAYSLHVPIAVYLQGQDQAFQTTILVNKKNQNITLDFSEKPTRLEVDPEFDLFRRLDIAEITSALSQGFGAENVLVVLPADASAPLMEGYRELAKTWQTSQAGEWDIVIDKDLKNLPTDRAIWLFGWENRFKQTVHDSLKVQDINFTNDNVKLRGKDYLRDANSILVTTRNSHNPSQTLLWLATENATAMPGLGRKLPHYRKYSYLAFEGDEPTNVTKGQWPIISSPMSLAITQADGVNVAKATGRLLPRHALAQLPPAFSAKRMMDDIRFLADETMAGRGLGTPELDKTAQYIAEAFRNAGLQQGGDNGKSYFQQWQQDVGKPLGLVTLKNVIGILPGTDPQFSGQSVVIGAHYDHLGRGWPDVHRGDEGKTHPGADDNASGVAVMLELARAVGKKWQPARTVIFIAFSGEEAGHYGSSYYVKNEKTYPAQNAIAMINLDTVGRLGKNDLTVFGTDSASEWVHIFRGTGFVTGIGVKSVPGNFTLSDQLSFITSGIPAVQFFGTVHTDFHRPGDTVDKIDEDGLIKTAAILKETVEYLAARPEPLTSSLATKPEGQATSLKQPTRGRRVSIGTVPDFDYDGKGVRITGVVSGSPAEKAGLRDGDVLIKFNTTQLDDLASYAKELRRLTPGEQVTLTYLREKETQRVDVTVVNR